jgi:predicted choloylglycine hydrolase
LIYKCREQTQKVAGKIPGVIKRKDDKIMQNVKTAYFELEGTHYEIGRQMAKLLAKDALYAPAPELFSEEEINNAISLYDQFCPGITEELRGFCDETGMPLHNNAYLWMTYLIPRCSSVALTPAHTQNGHTLLARNYEFGIEEEDFHVYRLAPKGKYAHIGGSLLEFGRTEGINEKGLAVSVSSCGFPVSNIPQMRAPHIRGLQFYAVLRSLLDSCSCVDEALETVQKIPIGYNINLILADREQNIALVETMNGEMAIQRGKDAPDSSFLCVTNHIAISSFKDRESMAMRNSLVRYETLNNFVNKTGKISEEQMKQFLLTKYPEGMTAWFYKDYFGTVKSVVMDVNEGRFSICWGGRAENGWEDFYVDKKIGNQEKEISVINEPGNKEFFEFVPF